MNPGTQQARLEKALRQQHREAHGSTCECRAFEVEQVIGDGCRALPPRRMVEELAEEEGH